MTNNCINYDVIQFLVFSLCISGSNLLEIQPTAYLWANPSLDEVYGEIFIYCKAHALSNIHKSQISICSSPAPTNVIFLCNLYPVKIFRIPLNIWHLLGKIHWHY